MLTSQALDAKLRSCPIPKDAVCPHVLIIPRGSTVKVFRKTEFYKQSDGREATWRKIEFQSKQGWINESLLSNDK
jgi:hypothetical protein